MSENISNNNQNQKDKEHSSEREYGNGRFLSSSRFIMIRKLETGSRYKDGNLKWYMVNEQKNMNQELEKKSQSGSESLPCEIITIVSGKGGTGKTFIAACLAYALKQAKRRVCLIDTDFATQGLSLFILGTAAEHGTSRGIKEENSLYHMVKKWGNNFEKLPVPLDADREDDKDHGVSYKIIISNKQFYDRRLSLGIETEAQIAKTLLNESMGEVTDKFRENYRSLIKSLFYQMSTSGKFDYMGAWKGKGSLRWKLFMLISDLGVLGSG